MQRICYVMTEGIGNAVLALPAIEALHDAGHEVSVVGKHPALDIIPDEFRAYTLDTLDGVNTPFDAILLSPWSADYIAKYGRAPHIGEGIPVYEADPIDGTQHETLIHFDLAGCIDGVEMPKSLSDVRLPKIPTDSTGLKEIQEGDYIVFANCAAPLWDRKRWQGYSDLAHLIGDEYHIVMLGGENDKKYYDPDYFPNTESHFNLPLRQVAAILDNAEWVVGNDCGLVHIASALGTKTIALFGPTSRKKNKPLGSLCAGKHTTQVLNPRLSCSPCQYEQWESVCQDWACQRLITPELVVNHIKKDDPFSLYHIFPSKKKQTLACVMRVKDAIDTIEECLTAAARICDYFCIVDNGSTDGTLEYLHKFCQENPEKWLGRHSVERTAKNPFVIKTEGYDQPRDREVMDILLKNSGATWGIFLDADEIVSDQITRELVETWMNSDTYNGYRFRHVHFWNDSENGDAGEAEHYRTDQRWKPRHNRMMWRITPESTIQDDAKIHPGIVHNLKGRILDTDYCIKHYGHLDKAKNAKRAEFYKSIDNPTLPDFSGMTYQHMTDETELKLAKWNENTPIDERDFGNPSVMLVLMHAGGDMLMATPTIRALASQNPNLEISVMGLGKTNEKDFKTREFFENNPFVHRYYDSSIDHHPVYWDEETFYNRELPIIHKDLERIQQLTRFDEVIIVTLRSDYKKHRIDRFATACGVELSDKQMMVLHTLEDTNFNDNVFPKLEYCVKIISIHRWCGNPTKSWDYQEYKALCKRLLDDPEIGLILWDMGDSEELIRHERVVNMSDYVDDLTVGRSSALMFGCTLHIGADSMPMHLASAVNTPTIAIFEKSLPSTAAPLNDNAVIATSAYALYNADPDFYPEHAHRVVQCGLRDVKAEHLYPILHKMGYIDDDDFKAFRRGTCNLDGYEIVIPESDRESNDNPHIDEIKVAKALRSYVIRQESVFMDVGANIGKISLMTCDFIKHGIAIEPFPESYEMLCENLKQVDQIHQCFHGEDLFETLQLAISDTEGTMKMNWLTRGVEQAKLSTLPEYLSIDVKTTTLDALGYTPDLLKIDVEGAELSVLKGATETLKTVRAMVIELHGVDDEKVFWQLAHHGFRVRYLAPRYILATAKGEEMLPFPQNCLFDPAELLTAEHNGILSFQRQADIYKTLTEFDNDSTWWFEYIGFGENWKRDGGFGKVLVCEGGEFMIAPTLMWYTQFETISIIKPSEQDKYSDALEKLRHGQMINPPAKIQYAFYGSDLSPVDTLILTNLLGYPPDAECQLFELLHRTNPKQLYINFPFSTDGRPTRYRGRLVTPYTYETLDFLRNRLAKRGYYPVGDTDFHNMDLRYDRDFPHAGQHVTRGRLLLDNEMPF